VPPANIEIIKVNSTRQRKQFVKFPWQIYKDDPYWVPPLISSQLSRLNPQKSPFFQQGEAELFIAVSNNRIAGTVVPWMNHRANDFLNEKGAGFGFFEVFNDYDTAAELLETTCKWAKERNAEYIRGPLYFSPQDSPGIVVKGFDSIPPPMVSHTPPYYADFLEKFGFRKHRDALAYRIELTPFENDLNNLPQKLRRVAQGVEKRYKVTIRNLRLNDWENELKSAIYIFNKALGYQREGVPMADAEFIKLASSLRKIIDPQLIFVAEVENKPIGLYVALPNINEVLLQLNGRLFPFGWIKLLQKSKYISMASTKILGVLEEYRNKGVDALFYWKFAEVLLKRGHSWVDFSLIAEENEMANRLVQRLGGSVYKICRTYHLNL